MYLIFCVMIRRPPRSTRTDTLFPYTTRFRSERVPAICQFRGAADGAFRIAADQQWRMRLLHRAGLDAIAERLITAALERELVVAQRRLQRDQVLVHDFIETLEVDAECLEIGRAHV